MEGLEERIGGLTGMSGEIGRRMGMAGNDYRGLGGQLALMDQDLRGIDTDLSGDIGAVRQSGQDVAGLASDAASLRGDLAKLRGQASDQYTDTDALRGVSQRLREGQEGMIGDAATLQAQAGDINALTQDQGMYAGLAEQARKGQERGAEEAQRRAIAQSGGDARDAQRMLAGAAGDRKTAAAEAARQDQLTAANQSIRNRQGMMGQQGGFLGQRSGLTQAAQAGVGQEANLLNQRGNALGQQAALAGQEAGLLGQQANLMDRVGQSAAQAAGLTAQQAGLQSGMVNNRANLVNNQANMIRNRLNALQGESGQVAQQLGAQGQIGNLLNQQGALANTGLNDLRAQAGFLGQQGQNMGAQSNLLGQQAGFLNNRLAGQGMQGNLLNNQMSGYGQQMNALGQMGQNFGQQANLYNNQIGAAMNQGQLLNNQGSMLNNMSGIGLNNAGFMAGMYDRQLQDYVARQNAMDQARLAAAGMNFQGNMANYNRPSGFEQLTSAALPAAIAFASDIRVKDQIRNEGSEMDQFLSSLQPHSFVYKKDPTNDRHYGIMAQDLEQTAAGASTVVDAPDGVKMVDLQRLVPLMAAAMGRMAQRIEELERS